MTQPMVEAGRKTGTSKPPTAGFRIKANGHEQAENLWELYSVGPQSTPDPASWRTELNRPLKS